MTLSHVDDSPVDFLPDHAFGADGDIIVDLIPMDSYTADGDTIVDLINGSSLGPVLDVQTVNVEDVSTTALYNAAAVAPVVLGAIRGPQVAQATLTEGHLKPVVALLRSLSRQTGAGALLTYAVPANRPLLDEVIEWRACGRTGGAAGKLIVTLGGVRLVELSVGANTRVEASGVLLRLTTASAPAMATISRALGGSAVALGHHAQEVVGSPTDLQASIVGGVVDLLDIVHAGRAA